MKTVMVPKKLNSLEPERRREVLEEAVEWAWHRYEEGGEFDPVFNLVARIERLEQVEKAYAS